MPNPFDQFDRPQAPPAGNPFDQFDQDPSFESGMLRAAGQGVSLGFGDEIEAGLRAPFSDRNYSEIRDEIRKQVARFRETNPVAAYGTEIASGALLPFGAARAANLARQGLTAGNVARGAVQIGAPTGAAYGVGAAEGISTPGEYAAEAAKGAGIGAAGYAVGAPLVAGATRAAQSVGRAVSGAVDPRSVATRKLAREIQSAGLTPEQIRAEVVPPPSVALRARNIGEDQIADMIGRAQRGDPVGDIAQAYGVAPGTVQAYVRRYVERNPAPAGIVDIAKTLTRDQGRTGADMPVSNLVRTAAGLAPDEQLANAASRLRQRQINQGGRTQQHISRAVGGEDFEGTQATATQALQRESDTAYTAFYNEPGLPGVNLDDLRADPLFQRAERFARRQEALNFSRANRQAGTPGQPMPQMQPSAPGSGQADLYSPQMLDQIQRQLRLAGEAASDPNASRLAQGLRREFLDRIEQHYPTFAGIRRNYAEGRGGLDALEAGASLAPKLGGTARELTRDFDAMTPAQQLMFRIGFARRLMDQVANKGEGAEVIAQFRTDAGQQLIRRIYPPQIANRLIRDLNREAVSTESFREIFHILRGNITAGAQQNTKQFMEDATLAGSIGTGRFLKAAESLSDRMITGIGKRQAGEILDIATTTEPDALIQAMNQVIAAGRGLNRGDRTRQNIQDIAAILAAERPAESGSYRQLPPR